MIKSALSVRALNDFSDHPPNPFVALFPVVPKEHAVLGNSLTVILRRVENDRQRSTRIDGLILRQLQRARIVFSHECLVPNL